MTRRATEGLRNSSVVYSDKQLLTQTALAWI